MSSKIVLTLLIVFLSISTSVLAHPGNTASDGCHYCRTNCDKWGVSWNERHCHGGGTSSESVQQPVQQQQIIRFNSPIPLPTWTSKPRPTRTPTPTRIPRPTKIIKKILKVKSNQLSEDVHFLGWMQALFSFQ